MLSGIFIKGKSSKGEGRGSGLYIANALCKIMGGDIKAVSCDTGGKFLISLPE